MSSRRRFYALAHHGSPWIAIVALSLGGCGVNAESPMDPGSKPAPNVWGKGYSLGTGDISLDPGEETTLCVWMRLPNTDTSRVVAIESTLAPGSHHLIVYRDAIHKTEQLSPRHCYPFAGLLDGTVPLYIAQTQKNTLTLPAGVAYELEPGQMIRIEAHYLNASDNAITARGDVILHEVVPGAQTVAADMLFWGSVYPLRQPYDKTNTPGIPPHTEMALRHGFKEVPPGAKIYAFTSHTHQLGTHFSIERSTDFEVPGSPLYENSDWEHPPLQTYDVDHVLTFAPGEGLRWQCSYNNRTDNYVGFGESAANDEMCFLWAYYYPSQGFKILFQ